MGYQDDVMKTARNKGAVGKNAVVPKYVEATVEVGKTILDFGCGHGAHVASLAEKGHNVTGYDFHENEYTEPNARSYEYDVVYLSNVLNVQPDVFSLNKVLEEASECVADGGQLIVNLAKDPWKNWASWKDVVQMLYALGFERVKGTHIFTWLRNDDDTTPVGEA